MVKGHNIIIKSSDVILYETEGLWKLNYSKVEKIIFYLKNKLYNKVDEEIKNLFSDYIYTEKCDIDNLRFEMINALSIIQLYFTEDGKKFEYHGNSPYEYLYGVDNIPDMIIYLRDLIAEIIKYNNKN